MPDASSILAIAIGAALGLLITTIASYLRRKARAGVRPAGVAIIAVFQLGYGAVLLVGFVFMFVAAVTDYAQLQLELNRTGTSPESLLPKLFTASTISLLGGWGLWRGTGWGWRFALFAIACGVVRNLLSLVFDGTSLERQGAAFFYTQHMGRAALNLLMLAYLYRGIVLRHCDLSIGRMAHARSLLVSVVLSFMLEIGLRILNR